MTALPQWPIVGATGHRPQHLTPGQRHWAQKIAFRVADRVKAEHGCVTAVSGLALGWDTWWAIAALDVGLHVWAHIPYESQPDRWGAADRRMWAELRAAATKETVYGPNPASKHEAARLLHARNDGMLHVSDAMACLWLPTKRDGGTWHAVRKVAATDKPAIHLDPTERAIRFGLPNLD